MPKRSSVTKTKNLLSLEELKKERRKRLVKKKTVTITSKYFPVANKKVEDDDLDYYLDEIKPEQVAPIPSFPNYDLDDFSDFELVKTPPIVESSYEENPIGSSPEQEFAAPTQLISESPPLSPSPIPVYCPDSPTFSVPFVPSSYYVVVFKTDCDAKSERLSLAYAFEDETRAKSFLAYRFWEAHVKYHASLEELGMFAEPGTLYAKKHIQCLCNQEDIEKNCRVKLGLPELEPLKEFEGEISDSEEVISEPEPLDVTEVRFCRDHFSDSSKDKEETYATTEKALERYLEKDCTIVPVTVFPTKLMLECVSRNTNTSRAIFPVHLEFTPPYSRLFGVMKVTTIKVDGTRKIKDYELVEALISEENARDSVAHLNSLLDIFFKPTPKLKMLNFPEESCVSTKYKCKHIPIVSDDTPFWMLFSASGAFSYTSVPIGNMEFSD